MRQLEWGYKEVVPENALAAWGARLIYPNDLVWDRQDIVYQDDESKKALIGELNGGLVKGVFKDLKKWADAGQIRSNLDKHIEVAYLPGPRLRVAINPRGSCGYVYISAWIEAEEER